MQVLFLQRIRMKIESKCRVEGASVFVNENLVFTATSERNLLKEWYLHLKLDYPKFYKMDGLCKLAFLGTIQILGGKAIEENTAMCFCNSGFSHESDLKHLENITTRNMSSPAVFVYTLPNIAMGEIAIYQKWKGENHFYGCTHFSEGEWLQEANRLIELKQAPHVIGGWADTMPLSAELLWVSALK